MIYCVVPQPLVDELYPTLLDHYRDEQNVTVIIDRRKAERRERGAHLDAVTAQRRIVRDRRRARVPGDLPALALGASE